MLQANEMLLSAKSIKNPEEREAKLREALQVCKQFVFWHFLRVILLCVGSLSIYIQYHNEMVSICFLLASTKFISQP